MVASATSVGHRHLGKRRRRWREHSLLSSLWAGARAEASSLGCSDVIQDSSITPVFGALTAGCPRVLRPSAYAVIENELGLFAVVVTPGGCFLPGGGLENLETPEEAIGREVLEEC